MVKAALVLQGGGTRGAFTSGALDVFMENDLYFEYVIGTSAGALNGYNYVAKDVGRSRKILCDLINDKKFLSVHNLIVKKSAFDFSYLFFQVPKSVVPFNQEEFDSSPIDFYACATCLNDGKPAYFRKKDNPDFLLGLQASSSLPLISKPVMISKKAYLDGGITDAIPFKKPLEEGWDKVVVVTTRDENFRKGALKPSYLRLAKRLYREYPEFLKSYEKTNEVYNQDTEEMYSLERQGKLKVLRSLEPLDVSPTETDLKVLGELYQRGREVAQSNLQSLKEYLEK